MSELKLPSRPGSKLGMGIELGNIRISNSKANTWRRCPKQYEFKYVDKLERKQKAIQLKRGSWLHELLEVHYKGGDWREVHAEYEAGFMLLFEEEREEYGDLPGDVKRLFLSYLMNYKEEDSHLNIVDTELNEIVTLPNGDEFNLIIDLVVEEADGGLWLWDHKTVKDFMPPDFMVIDAQLARYFWAAEKLGYTPLRGVMFNELITRAPTLPKFLDASQRLEMRQNIVCDVYSYYREIKRLGLDPKPYRSFLAMLKSRNDRWFRRTPLPRDRALMNRQMEELAWTSDEIKIATALSRFPRTPKKDCRWDCDFLDLCQIQLQGGDTSQAIKLRYETKVPKEDQ